MNDIINNILNRRSIRKFNNKKIDTKDLEIITKCALHAPSAMGLETWYAAVINNDELIDELIKIMQKLLDDKDYTMYHPKALIILANKKDTKYNIEDNACALENIFLAAKSLNIGSVWINQLRHYLDNEDLKEYLLKLGIDDSMMISGVAALGYYDEEPKARIKKDNYKVFE